jgi:hypothetical protein
VKRRDLLAAIGASSLFASPARALAQPARGDRPFNGLTTGVGDLSRLSRAKTRSISPENFTGAKGGGGQAINGTGARATRRHRRPGRHPAHLDDAHRPLALLDSARLLGR